MYYLYTKLTKIGKPALSKPVTFFEKALKYQNTAIHTLFLYVQSMQFDVRYNRWNFWCWRTVQTFECFPQHLVWRVSNHNQT